MVVCTNIIIIRYIIKWYYKFFATREPILEINRIDERRLQSLSSQEGDTRQHSRLRRDTPNGLHTFYSYHIDFSHFNRRKLIFRRRKRLTSTRCNKCMSLNLFRQIKALLRTCGFTRFQKRHPCSHSQSVFPFHLDIMISIQPQQDKPQHVFTYNAYAKCISRINEACRKKHQMQTHII